MNMRPSVGIIWVGLSALLAAAYAVPGNAATRTVIIQGMAYQPATVTAHVGDTVVWQNEDLVPHTVTAQGRHFDSGDLPPGKAWHYKMTKKGRYPYTCTYHPTMHGVLVVRYMR